MITRPSTDQILRDVADELQREIMPLLSDSTDQVRLHMITAVINQCAGRASREIAVMKDEIAQMSRYVADVAAASENGDVQAALTAIAPSDDVLLTSVSDEYVRASEALGTAIEVAMDASLSDLVTRGEALLRERITNEQQMADVASAGR